MIFALLCNQSTYLPVRRTFRRLDKISVSQSKINVGPVLRSRSEPVLFGRSRYEDVKAKTFVLLLFSLFLYEKEL